jgi:hypothetical protein
MLDDATIFSKISSSNPCMNLEIKKLMILERIKGLIPLISSPLHLGNTFNIQA